MNNKGEVKLADFGLSINFSASSGRLYKSVTTLLYRAPEQVFGIKNGYDLQSDMWSVGCIFAELLICEPLFCSAKNFQNFVELLLVRLGKESFDDWAEITESETFQEHKNKLVKDTNIKNYLKTKKPHLDPQALDLLFKLLMPNPAKRISAKNALEHPYFTSDPLPCNREEIPKIELECHEYTIRKAYLKKKLAMQAKINEKQAAAVKPPSDVQASFGINVAQKMDVKWYNAHKRSQDDRNAIPVDLKRHKFN